MSPASRVLSWPVVVLLTLVVSLSVVLTAVVQARIDRSQLEVTCTSARANVEQLRAIEAVAIELGVPVTFTIPKVPPECEEV